MSLVRIFNGLPNEPKRNFFSDTRVTEKLTCAALLLLQDVGTQSSPCVSAVIIGFRLSSLGLVPASAVSYNIDQKKDCLGYSYRQVLTRPTVAQLVNRSTPPDTSITVMLYSTCTVQINWQRRMYTQICIQARHLCSYNPGCARRKGGAKWRNRKAIGHPHDSSENRYRKEAAVPPCQATGDHNPFVNTGWRWELLTGRPKLAQLQVQINPSGPYFYPWDQR
jgi:hypothetical protein